jgi:hypothetical protein
LEDVLLGVCIDALFETAEDHNGRFGLCHELEEDVAPSAGLVLLDNTSYVLDAGDITVKRGQTYTLEHTFKFTASEAGTISLTPTFRFLREGYPSPDLLRNDMHKVTFR